MGRVQVRNLSGSGCGARRETVQGWMFTGVVLVATQHQARFEAILLCADEHISLHLLEIGPKEVELRNFG